MPKVFCKVNNFRGRQLQQNEQNIPFCKKSQHFSCDQPSWIQTSALQHLQQSFQLQKSQRMGSSQLKSQSSLSGTHWTPRRQEETH